MIYVIIIAAILLIWVVANYNFFVSSKTRIKAAIQEIGNQLKRQADLIPNLEESAKGYLQHEKSIFTELTGARKSVTAAAKSGNLQKMADAGQEFASVLSKLQVIVESNPEIKGSEVVRKLMEELRDTSDKVMYSRRLLIDLTADYNVKRVAFPTNLVANLFKFEEMAGLKTPTEGEHLTVSESEAKLPKVKF